MRSTSNKFLGRCECGAHVPAGAGRTARSGGKWIVRCIGHAAGDEASRTRAGWVAYRDGERWVIGRADWQTCTSSTYGVTDAYSRDEVREALAAAGAMSDAEAEAAKRAFETPGRFERACGLGVFGPVW